MTPLLWVLYAHAAAVALDNNNDDNDNDGPPPSPPPPPPPSDINDDKGEHDEVGASSSTTSTNKEAIWELALLEFPYSSLLHYAVVLDAKQTYDQCHQHRQHKQHKQHRQSSYESKLQVALNTLGMGSHAVDPLVYELYRMALDHYGGAVSTTTLGDENHPLPPPPPTPSPPSPQLWELLLQCLQYCPLILEGTVHPESTTLVTKLLDQPFSSRTPSHLPQQVEEARKLAAHHYQHYRTYEDDLVIALTAQGIVTPYAWLIDAKSTSSPDWWTTINVETVTCGMGLGNYDTARVYMRYARALSKHQQSYLALCLYERAIAECPTIEHVWSDYCLALERQIIETSSQSDASLTTSTTTTRSLLVRLESVLSRAVRHCPYSMRLAQRKLTTTLLLAHHQHSVLDPESLLEQADQMLATKFLVSSSSPGMSETSVTLELYQTIVQVIKQRILAVLAQADATESPKGGEGAATVSIPDEVQDLCDDLLELYDELDQRFKTQHPSGKETQLARCCLWRDASKTMLWLVGPLQQTPSQPSHNGSNHHHHHRDDKALKWAQQALKLYNPPHPDLYLDCVHLLLREPPAAPNQVLSWIGNIRSVFDKAIRCVGRPNPPVPRWREYGLALQALGQEWMDFEQTVGTEESLKHAREAVTKKLSAATTKAASSEDKSTPKSSLASGRKRAAADNNEPDALAESEPSTKRVKGSEANAPAGEKSGVTRDEAQGVESSSSQPLDDVSTVEESKSPKKVVVPLTIRVGKLDFPVHPYTVRVLNLSPDTQDMDLVDAFKRCGPIVHARILRDKHGAGRHAGIPPSKGWGLVQFEERDAVESALELNDVIGLHEKVLRVERSHIPAAILVPPGMHRVNEQGHGKYSKRNERRKELHQPQSFDHAQSKTGVQPDPSEHAKGEQDPNKEKVSNDNGAGAASKPTGSSMGVLSFRPRGVGRGGHQKPRISLPDPKT